MDTTKENENIEYKNNTERKLEQIRAKVFDKNNQLDYARLFVVDLPFAGREMTVTVCDATKRTVLSYDVETFVKDF